VISTQLFLMWFLLFVSTLFSVMTEKGWLDQIWVKDFIAPADVDEETMQKSCEWENQFDWNKGTQRMLKDKVYFRIDKGWEIENLRSAFGSARTIFDKEGNELKLFVDIEKEKSPGKWGQVTGSFFRGIFVRDKEGIKETSSSSSTVGVVFKTTTYSNKIEKIYWSVELSLSGAKLGMLEIQSNAIIHEKEMQKEIVNKFGIEYRLVSIDLEDKRLCVVQVEVFPITVIEVDGYNHMKILHEIFQVHSETTFRDLFGFLPFGRLSVPRLVWTRYDISFEGLFSDMPEEAREENLSGKEEHGEKLMKMKIMDLFPEIQKQPNRRLLVQDLSELLGGGGY